MSTIVVFPRLDQDMQEGTIVSWLVEVGDRVNAGDELAEMETAKVTAAIESPADGTVLAILVNVGELAPVGSPIAIIGEEGEPLPPEAKASTSERPRQVTEDLGAQTSVSGPTPVFSYAPEPNDGRTLVLPIDRTSWSRPHQLSPRERYEAQTKEPSVAPPLAKDAEPAPFKERQEPKPAARRKDGRRVELNSIRQATIRTVQASWQIPQFSVEALTPTSALKALLDKVRQHAPDVKVTITDMIAAAMAKAIRTVPEVNAWFERDGVRYFDEVVDLSLMVQTDQGLYVPVIQAVNERTLRGIAAERQKLTDAARAGKLKPEQLQPGTIALSNLGMFNIHRFNAIIFPPQVAILAVGRAQVDREGEPVWLTLTVDHRVVDGAIAARYLEALQALFAEPLLLLV